MYHWEKLFSFWVEICYIQNIIELSSRKKTRKQTKKQWYVFHNNNWLLLQLSCALGSHIRELVQSQEGKLFFREILFQQSRSKVQEELVRTKDDILQTNLPLWLGLQK